MRNKVCSKCNIRKAATNFEKETSMECLKCKPKKPKGKTKKED